MALPRLVRLFGSMWFLLFAPWAEAQSDQDLLLPLPAATLSTPLPATGHPALASDPQDVDFYLLTIGRGEQVYALFGHTILRVIDRKRRVDDNYNWGIFDFKDPWFAWKFYRGDLNYVVNVSDFGPLIDNYAKLERRSVVQEKINLTEKQKRTLLERLAWNLRPENVPYKYFQFRDNCATKPRDYLDEALGGALRQKWQVQYTPITFRDHIRRDARPLWWVEAGLDLTSNSLLDRPITPWEEMYLPSHLRQHLLATPAFDDDGNPIPNQNLLSGSTTIVALPEPASGAPAHAWLALWFGVPISLLSLMAIPGHARPTAFAGGEWRTKGLGIAGIVVGFCSGAFGIILLANWILSNYLEVSHNALLLMFFPLDWLFVAYGLSLLKHGVTSEGWLGRAVRALSGAHILGLALLFFGRLTGLIAQDVTAVLASFGLAALLFYTALLRTKSKSA